MPHSSQWHSKPATHPLELAQGHAPADLIWTSIQKALCHLGGQYPEDIKEEKQSLCGTWKLKLYVAQSSGYLWTLISRLGGDQSLLAEAMGCIQSSLFHRKQHILTFCTPSHKHLLGERTLEYAPQKQGGLSSL